MGTIKDRNGMANRSRKYSEEVARIEKKYAKKSLWSDSQWCDHSPRARHPGMLSQVGLKK